jgi:hypothetical protein
VSVSGSGSEWEWERERENTFPEIMFLINTAETADPNSSKIHNTRVS